MTPLIRAALNDYLRLGIATPGGVPLLSLSGQAEIDGALLNGPQTVAILNQLTAANAATNATVWLWSSDPFAGGAFAGARNIPQACTAG